MQGLAIMELKTALAMLCIAFQFRLALEIDGPAGIEGSESMALTLHTTHGIRVQCIPRKLWHVFNDGVVGRGKPCT